MYSGACTVQTHATRIKTGNAEYTYWKFEDGAWANKGTRSSWDALADEKWDIITMQEHSLAALRGWETYTKPFVMPLISGIMQRIDYNVSLAWCLTHTYAVGYSDSGFTINDKEEQIAMYDKIVGMVNWVMGNCPVKFIIPWGTATQNAKGTSLDSLGDFGNGMSNDGLHLQEGIGCMIEAYVTVLTIFDLIDRKIGILGDNTNLDVERINSQDETYTIGGHIGNGAVGLTSENIKIGQLCATMANKFPTQIFEMSTIISE